MGGVQVGRGGGGWMGVQSMGKMGKDVCPNVLQLFLENIDRRSCNDESRELIQHFTTLTKNADHLGGVPS